MIVAVLVAADHAEDALLKHLQHLVHPAGGVAGIGENPCHFLKLAQLFVQLPDCEQACVRRDLSALEIRDELLMLIETEGQLPATPRRGSGR